MEPTVNNTKQLKNNPNLITKQKQNRKMSEQSCTSAKMQDNDPKKQKSYLQLTKEIVQASLPITGGILVTYLLMTINLHYLGQLGQEIIVDSVGIGYSLINCGGQYFMLGVNQAFGAFVGRAYGAKNKQLMENYFYKGLCLLFAFFILFFTLIAYSYQIMLILGQSEQMARITHYFLISILPGFFCQFMFDFLKNYINAQQIYNPPLIFQSTAVVINVIASQQLIPKYQLDGSIMAINITNGYMMLGMTIFFIYNKYFPSLPRGGIQEVLLNIGVFIKEVTLMSIPNELDVVVYEVNNILIGSLKNIPQIAANVSCVNLIALFYAAPLGIGASLNYIVSNAIGRRDVKTAKKCYIICLYMILILGSAFMAILWGFQNQIAQFYSSNPQVKIVMNKIMQLYYAGIFFDYIVASCMPLLKAMGKAKQTLYNFMFSFYCIGMPSSIYLGLYCGLGVYGFWIGFLFSLFVAATIINILFITMNWEQQVEILHTQLQKEHKDLDNQDIITNEEISVDKNDIINKI